MKKKKEKLTPEERKELKREVKIWMDFIRRMEKKGALIKEGEAV